MNTAASWATILLLWGAVMAATIAVQALLDRRRDRRFNRHTDQALSHLRHPSFPRFTCELCGDRNIIHLDTHKRLSHRPVGPEDRPDWGADQ